jgi:hypothetical protein
MWTGLMVDSYPETRVSKQVNADQFPGIQGLREAGTFLDQPFGGASWPQPLFRYNVFDEIDFVAANGVWFGGDFES